MNDEYANDEKKLQLRLPLRRPRIIKSSVPDYVRCDGVKPYTILNAI